MTEYNMRLVNTEDFNEVLAVANTKLGLLRKYNKLLTSNGFKKISLIDLDNNDSIKTYYESGCFDKNGYDIETNLK